MKRWKPKQKILLEKKKNEKRKKTVNIKKKTHSISLFYFTFCSVVLVVIYRRNVSDYGLFGAHFFFLYLFDFLILSFQFLSLRIVFFFYSFQSFISLFSYPLLQANHLIHQQVSYCIKFTLKDRFLVFNEM